VFEHGHADHPAIGPTCRCFGLRREEGQRGNDRRGQDRGYTQEGAAWRADRVDREGGRRVGTHCEEVRQDGRPVARAPEEEEAGERGARPLRGDDRSWPDGHSRHFLVNNNTALPRQGLVGGLGGGARAEAGPVDGVVPLGQAMWPVGY
jgi:hypothetical protein